MKLFPASTRSRRVIIVFVCLVIFTGLVTGRAAQESAESSTAAASELETLALENEVESVEAAPSAEERSFLDSLGATEDEDEVAETLNEMAAKSHFTYTAKGGLESVFPFCARFMDSSGNYGTYGKIIANYLRAKYQRNRTTEMLADDLVGMETSPKICPNWRSFDTAERIKFWVWTFGAISAIEAQCGASKKGMTTGVRGTVWRYVKDRRGRRVPVYMHAIGLLQLEKELAVRKANRDAPSCRVKDIANSMNNLHCGIDIMEGLVTPDPPKKNGWPIYPGPGMDRKSYWLHLTRTNGGAIGAMIRAYAPCHASKPAPTFSVLPWMYPRTFD